VPVAATTRRSAAETAGPALLNRELSWLDLNERVLDLAADPAEPLLERIKFCAIFSSNLDEFFMVRVAGLLDQVIARVNVRSPDGRTPLQALAELRERVLELDAKQSRLWSEELSPALAAEGIRVGTIEDVDAEGLRELESRFAREIYPVLTPLAVSPGQPFPYISGLSLSLGVTVRDPDSGEERFARVKVPETLPRFQAIGDDGLLIPLELVMSHHLSWLFPGMDLPERAVFRVTRDGDTEISDDADDLLEAVESELRRRRFGAVVRLEVSSSISQAMVARLAEQLPVRSDAVYPVEGLLALGDLMQLHDLDRPDLKYEPLVPHTQRRLAKPRDGDLFRDIASSDIVFQHPYDSFATSVEAFVREAARDPAVATLKTTVNRTSDESALAPSLIEAAENGKQSVCVVELKARFDEERNIEWARALEQAGVHVVYGFPDLKIHAKTTLVIRREGDGLRRYAHIGTGNYNATTARQYEDVGLLTADPDITADVADLFNFITGFGRPQRFRKILTAPFNLRRELVERIRAVGMAAAAGEQAAIRIKVNNITDPAIVEELYRASQAGAEIDLIVRAVSVLEPGIAGVSDRIRVRSILGRFLEHSRLFCFQIGETKNYLMGSADLMQRNLDHRIEVLVPVESPHVRAEIETILRRLLSDNSQAWTLGPDGCWTRLKPGPGERRRSAQALAMRGRGRARRPTPSG
jgi:polyphosphate kinase